MVWSNFRLQSRTRLRMDFAVTMLTDHLGARGARAFKVVATLGVLLFGLLPGLLHRVHKHRTAKAAPLLPQTGGNQAADLRQIALLRGGVQTGVTGNFLGARRHLGAGRLRQLHQLRQDDNPDDQQPQGVFRATVQPCRQHCRPFCPAAASVPLPAS